MYIRTHQVCSHQFWTAPRLFWEMPISLAADLATSRLVIVKGIGTICYVCIYVFVCVYICVYIYICIHIYIHIYTCMRIYKYENKDMR